MKAVVGAFLMLLICHGVETYCEFRLNGSHCNGALGGTVVLRLMNSTSGINRFKWIKNNTETVIHWFNKIYFPEISSRASFTPDNGTLIINKLRRTDEGQYTLKCHNSEGRQINSIFHSLTIQAPVSSVTLVSECLSEGEMRVSCSSKEGDSPLYSWTLDGYNLTKAQLLSGNKETNSITLKQGVSGRLVCTVRNHINSDFKVEKIASCSFINCTLLNGTHLSQWVREADNTQCNELPTTIIGGKETDITVSNKPSTNFTSSNQTRSITGAAWFSLFTALLILLLGGVAFICVHRKRQNNKGKAQKTKQEMYANVGIMDQHRRQITPKAENEVEYTLVNFKGQPRQTADQKSDNHVYAQVRVAK
ncbi:uncharacterized protein [Antennarius striatus]|uniref:uncharacterized protein isoform X2 n=1 Tax=Antennarius striatus TaxID=241820 RepID=UPI0035B34DA7